MYVIPPALGIDQRIVNGYLYISPNSITDPDLIAQRAELFTQRAGHYYDNWDEIYEQWITKAEDCIERLQGHRLPRRCPRSSRSRSSSRTAG